MIMHGYMKVTGWKGKPMGLESCTGRIKYLLVGEINGI